MPVEVILPKVDMDMETGLISGWHVSEGDRVTKGQPLFDIETDKAAMEVESPADGIIHHISAAAGDTVPIGEAVAWLFGDDETVGEAPSKTSRPTSKPIAEAAPDVEQTPEPALAEAGIRATPAARRVARESRTDLAGIKGSGPRGRIQRADIKADQQSAPSEPEWDSGGASLSVLRSGPKTGRPQVLIHGFAGDASAWNSVEEDLTRSGPVIRMELPCHGASPLLNLTSFADLVACMRASFDELQMQDVHLVGHSLGGAIALALADTRPRAISKLTLISPAGLGPQINGEILDGIGRGTGADSLGPWLSQLVWDSKLITDSYAQAVARARQDAQMRAAQQQMAGWLFADGTQCFDVSAALERVTCPTRLIWGKSDQVIPWSHALRAPGAVSLNLLEQTGHLPQVEQPELVSKLLRM